MKNLKFYSIFIFSLISFFTQAQDYSFVINKMYSGDNSTRRIILQEATEEHGKTSLIIEYKNNAEKIESLIEERDVSLKKINSDFDQNNTHPEDNSYCEKAKSLENKAISLRKQVSQVGIMLNMAKVSYELCANNIYRTTNCQNELNNYNSYNNRYNSIVDDFNTKNKSSKYNADRCNSYISYYNTKLEKLDREYKAIANNYMFKIRSLEKRQAVIFDELVNIMENRPYLSETRYPNGNIESTGIRLFGNGNANGIWTYYHENGEIKQIGEYVDSSGNGIWKYYYENGELKEIGEWIDGSANGIWKYYHENGKIKHMGMFKEGEKIGVWKVYDENGAFKEEVKF